MAFSVYLAPVNNEAPLLQVGSSELFVSEGGFVELNTINIQLKDADTEIEDITICVKNEPKNGVVENISPAVGAEQARVGIGTECFSLDEVTQGEVIF